MSTEISPNKSEVLSDLAKYLRFVDYLSVAQLYLRDNFMLDRPLVKDDIKRRILGHWGTVPGLNMFYAQANILIQRHNLNALFIAGPGHGAPAILSNLFVENSLGEYYPKYQLSKKGAENLIKDFSWPSGFPSHVNPHVPGSILEGGELGYSLGTAFGTVMDNPDLFAFVVIGDGEAETATIATSWHSTKFISPRNSGAVLPIVHINKFKISGPTIFSSMSNDELNSMFIGLGYEPLIIEKEALAESLMEKMEYAYQKIIQIQKQARENKIIDKPQWPVLLVKSAKGMHGLKEFAGKKIEDSFRSHGIPLENPIENEQEFLALKKWLESYRIHELIDDQGNPIQEILRLIPKKELRMGLNQHANGEISIPLRLPQASAYEIKIEKSAEKYNSSLKIAGNYLRDVIKMNPTNFRVMCPDETESNKLSSLFETTERAYLWPVPEASEHISPDGRVMEVLSENLLMSWMQGYILTGRHSILISYEAFLMIIASMVDQYSKFLAKAEEVPWRKPLPSINFILTSNSWRQDHNGFSHQNPGFISNALNKQSNNVNIFFPVDVNSTIATLNKCFSSFNKINIIVTGKRDLPQYLSLNQALSQGKEGTIVWDWVGNNPKDADVVFAASGDYMTFETLAAIQILQEIAPEINTRFVSISEITAFGIGDNHNHCRLDQSKFDQVFTSNKPIIYNYHGYPEDVKQLIYNHPASKRFHINGYVEKGTTTTPFDMMVVNNCSRYNLAIDALNYLQLAKPSLKKQIQAHLNYFKALLSKHEIYIKQYGYDMPEVTDFKLKFINND